MLTIINILLLIHKFSTIQEYKSKAENPWFSKQVYTWLYPLEFPSNVRGKGIEILD